MELNGIIKKEGHNVGKSMKIHLGQRVSEPNV